MPKEYSTWLGEMAGSIQDNSNWIKPSYDITTITPLQRRMHIADLLVGNIETEDDVNDWVTAFSVAFTYADPGYRKLRQCSLLDIVGEEELRAYNQIHTESQAKAWLNSLKEKIIRGTLR